MVEIGQKISHFYGRIKPNKPFLLLERGHVLLILVFCLQNVITMSLYEMEAATSMDDGEERW